MKKSIEISPKLETLFGTRDENLHVLEDGLNISIDLRSDSIQFEGAPRDVARAQQVFADYDHLQRSGFTFSNGDLNSLLRVLVSDPKATLRGLAESGRSRSFGGRTVQPKSPNQRRYLEAIEKHDMVFGIGPAGTGKTYLAVAMAISALLDKQVNRIILARPAVEAGERLGFLPGTLQEKIDPYLRPLYDALYRHARSRARRALSREKRHRDRAHRLHARPHAQRFVRHPRRSPEHHLRADEDVRDPPGLQLEGRDHRRRHPDRLAQRPPQRPARSGGNPEDVDGLTFVYFDESDVVRHHLVQRIIRAYDEFKTRLAERQLSLLEAKPAATPKPATNGQSADAESATSRPPLPPVEEPRVGD